MTIWTALVLIQMIVVHKLDLHAAEVTVYSGYYEQEADAEPPNATHRSEEGKALLLLCWEVVPLTLPARERTVKQEILYQAVEAATEIPVTMEVEVKDGGRKKQVAGQLVSQTDLNEQWQDGFCFPVTFHSYEADFYSLGDRKIPYRDSSPALEGCEELLLELIGVQPEQYRITGARWSGDPYTDGSGTLCRDAEVTGQKMVREVLATYQAKVGFEPETVWQVAAVYGETMKAESEDETVPRPEPQTKETHVVLETEAEVAREEESPSLWQRIIQTLYWTVAVGAVLFFGGLLLLLLLFLVKKVRAWYNR